MKATPAIFALSVLGLTTATLYACKTCVVDREPVQTYFGLNADPVGEVAYTDTRRFFNLFRETGAGSARIPLKWSQLEPQKGQWIFARADAALSNFPADVEVIVTLTGVPDWAKAADDDPNAAYPFKGLADWTAFVERVVGRYRNRVRHWEIWDAPDTASFGPRPTARAYLDVLKASHETIKRLDPKCLVILGGIDATALFSGEAARAKVTNFLPDLYDAGGAAYFDAANVQAQVQPLAGGPRVAELAREAAKVMAKYGDAEKPLYLSRVDLPPADGEAARAAQAQVLTETYQLLRKEKQVCHVFWYTLRDPKPAGAVGASGLLDQGWRKRPAFEAFRKAAQEKVIK
jgi:polysaccharide biosynthesis protein PslG